MYTGEKPFKEVFNDVVLGCERCSLHTVRQRIVFYRGNPKSDIMIVGEGPGEQEERQGKAMVGPTGSRLVSILAEHGLTLYDYYITNVILCRPPGNADPESTWMRSCSDWLNMQIDLIAPRLILAVGRYAASRLIPEFSLGTTAITRVEGHVYQPVHLDGAIVVPVRHPSAVMRREKETGDPLPGIRYATLIGNILNAYRDGSLLSSGSVASS